jgi:hypothetical protein
MGAHPFSALASRINAACLQFHLACLGMISPPEGSWFCDMCKQKRAAVRRGGRGGKRKATGRGK